METACGWTRSSPPAGRYSRREVRQLIRQGRVLVDGVPARSPEDKVDPEAAEITCERGACCATAAIPG